MTRHILSLLTLMFVATTGLAQEPEPAAPAAPAAPFAYVWATAQHILPQTTSEESGYFSLCQGLDGTVYVGTAKYNENAYLVAVDPATGTQRIAMDVNAAAGLTATGYAAQSKLHTRNHVGASGRVYVGSKQGYRRDGDTSEYPGGYVLVYDPATGRTESLGLPLAPFGVIDVVADPAEKLLYVVTCETEHWLVADLTVRPVTYRKIPAPELMDYASTLVDGRGRAAAITDDLQLAQYDPATGEVTVRPIHIDGQPLAPLRGEHSSDADIPTWRLAADGRTAYLIRMSESTLFAIDLYSEGPAVAARSFGPMIAGKGPDSRAALTIAPDGRVYTLVRVQNDTGFGQGMLHHLLRFDPATERHEDLGVLAVRNPDFFDFTALGPDGKRRPWTHGYHTLPDGTLTPLHAHMGLIAAADGSLYATILYPYSLLHIPRPD